MSVPHSLSTLTDLPDDSLIDVQTAAKLYQCSERHLWRSVERGALPRPLSVGRLRRWRIGTLREHIRAGCPQL